MLMKNLVKNPNFEMRFKLLTVGMDKVYEIIQKNRDVLEKEGESDKITEAKMILIENSCLLMDFIVNFNFENLIYQVFKKLKNDHYIGDLKWSLKFLDKHIDMLDELSTKEFEYIKENMPKIINDLPLPDYPYENKVTHMLPTPEKVQEYKKKAKERRKKGPSLYDPIKIEL